MTETFTMHEISDVLALARIAHTVSHHNPYDKGGYITLTEKGVRGWIINGSYERSRLGSVNEGILMRTETFGTAWTADNLHAMLISIVAEMPRT